MLVDSFPQLIVSMDGSKRRKFVLKLAELSVLRGHGSFGVILPFKKETSSSPNHANICYSFRIANVYFFPCA